MNMNDLEEHQPLIFRPSLNERPHVLHLLLKNQTIYCDC